MSKTSIFLAGVIAGLILLVGWRFFSYRPQYVHYHANFAVYINGQREQFTEPTYYEELAGCSLNQTNDPKERAHMHDNENDLVHVHAAAVTWEDFFANIGWSIGPDFIHTRTQLLVADDQHPVIYILNGQKVNDIADRVIGDQDRLLVSYGTADEQQLTNEFNGVASTAAAEDASPDPASCGGSSAQPTWQDRLQHVFN
jgi:hypothetical protein